jgi:uncharacterized membrane protein YoaK (UPF0700 family)
MSSVSPGSPPQRHRIIPLALLALTVSTGVVDAVSFLGLGRLFVANMTGNVLFSGFALAGSGEVSVVAPLVSLASFLLGAIVGGRLAARFGAHRGRHFSAAAGLTLPFVTAAAVSSVLAPVSGAGRYAVIVLLAAGMGVQMATARRLAVPDVTTSVVTMSLIGLVADWHGAVWRPNLPARVASILTMLFGAFAGGLLLLHAGVPAALGVAAALIAVSAVVVNRLSRGTTAEQWRPPPPAAEPPRA